MSAAAQDRPTLAVVPFGARPSGEPQGAVARQIARRVVQRFESTGLLRAEPVYLVAVGHGGDGGVLVFGSAPDASLAAQYARGLGATHALFGVLEDGKTLRTSLVKAADASEVARFETPVDDGALPLAEGALAIAVARALGVRLSDEDAGRLGAPPTEDPEAYRSFVLGMEAEMAATVLARDRPQEAEEVGRGAVASYVAALRVDPALREAEERLLYLAAERMQRGESEKAMELLEDVITAAPRSWRAHYMVGELRREAGLNAQAAVAFEFADALQPLSEADQLRLARIYIDTDALDSAAARLRRIKPGSPHYAAAEHELGVIALRKGEHPAAAEHLERARVAGERDEMLFVRLGQAYTAAGETAKARATFEEGLTLRERSWQVAAAFGAFLHGEADLSRAITLYQDALERGAPPPTRLNLGRALILTGRREEARRELLGLRDSAADEETAAQGRRLLFGLDDPEEEKRLEEAGQIAVGARAGDAARARETLEALAAAHPELWETHFGLGLVHRRLGDAAAAEASLRRALELWPRQPDALHELGVALLMQDRVEDAVHVLDDAVRERPDDPGYLADAGFGYLVAGNFIAARNRLEKARELDPEDEVTKRYLEELERREASA